MAQFTHDTIGGVVTLLSTELNSLAHDNASAYGPEIDNRLGATLAMLWLTIASSNLAFTSASKAEIHLVPSTVPDTASQTYPNYTSGSSYKLDGNCWVGDIWIHPATQSNSVVNAVLRGVYLPEGYFQSILIQKSGSGLTWPASGNTLKMYRTPLKVA